MLKEDEEEDEEDKGGIVAKLWKSGCWCCWGAYETKDVILFFSPASRSLVLSVFQHRTSGLADKLGLRLFKTAKIFSN
jgi:hypothetical protein